MQTIILTLSICAPVPTHLMKETGIVVESGPIPGSPGVYQDLHGNYVYLDLNTWSVSSCNVQTPLTWERTQELSKLSVQYGGYEYNKGKWIFYEEKVIPSKYTQQAKEMGKLK